MTFLANRNLKRMAAAVLVAMVGSFVLAAAADAGPKWRLRRWSSRPPIDPSIRTTARIGRAANHRVATPYRSVRVVNPVIRPVGVISIR